MDCLVCRLNIVFPPNLVNVALVNIPELVLFETFLCISVVFHEIEPVVSILFNLIKYFSNPLRVFDKVRVGLNKPGIQLFFNTYFCKPFKVGL